MAQESGAHSQLFTIYLVKLVKDNDFRARRLAAQLNGMSYRAKDKDVCVRACVYLYKGMSEGDAVPERPLSMWPFVIPLWQHCQISEKHADSLPRLLTPAVTDTC